MEENFNQNNTSPETSENQNPEVSQQAPVEQAPESATEKNQLDLSSVLR